MEICERGFHACESPLEVLDYYFMDGECHLARFCEVERSGNVDRENNGSTKIASTKIKVKAELNFADLIRLGVEWLKEKTSPEHVTDSYLSDNRKLGQKIGSSGNSAQIGSSGKNAVVMCAGYNSSAKAKACSWITLAEWGRDEETEKWTPVCVKTEYVDGELIKADTWYKLIDGEFKEVEDE